MGRRVGDEGDEGRRAGDEGRSAAKGWCEGCSGVRTRGDSNVVIRDHPSPPVNFLPFLIPGKFGKFGKFTFHRPTQFTLP
jgi:hypothetical protein